MHRGCGGGGQTPPADVRIAGEPSLFHRDPVLFLFLLLSGNRFSGGLSSSSGCPNPDVSILLSPPTSLSWVYAEKLLCSSATHCSSISLAHSHSLPVLPATLLAFAAYIYIYMYIAAYMCMCVCMPMGGFTWTLTKSLTTVWPSIPSSVLLILALCVGVCMDALTMGAHLFVTVASC